LDDKLAHILKIQSIDIRSDQIGKEKERIPRELEKQREEIEYLSKSVEGDRTVLEGLKVTRREVEKELEEIEAKHKKSKARLDEVKSNKEYQAVIKELEDIKALTNEKEELVIQKWRTSRSRRPNVKETTHNWTRRKRSIRKKRKSSRRRPASSKRR